MGSATYNTQYIIYYILNVFKCILRIYILMNIDIYKDKGLTGLANLGNTCFVNSCIQVLSHTYELNNFLNNDSYKKKLQKKYESAMLIEWDNLRILMWTENCIVAPNKFLKTIQKLAQIKQIDIFTGYAQNDLPEFLLFVVDCFHTGLAREVRRFHEFCELQVQS